MAVEVVSLLQVAVFLLFANALASPGPSCRPVAPGLPFDGAAARCLDDTARIASRLRPQQYIDFLAANPRIRDAIGLEGEAEYLALATALASLESRGRLPAFRFRNPRRPTHDELRQVHVRHAAFALWVELQQKVPWSLRAYSDADLRTLLGFRTLEESPGYVGQWAAELDEALVTGTARWLRSNPRETVLAMAEWVRGNVTHQSGDQRDPPTLARALQGGQVGHCHNTGDILAVSAMALNIPARTRMAETGHRYIDFPTERLALLHNDDLYTRGYETVPMTEIFVQGEEREAFLRDVERSPAEAARMNWLRPVRIELRYPTREFLAIACQSERAVVEDLYLRHACHGSCPTLSDYAPDVERIVREGYPAFRERAEREGACAPSPPATQPR
jgi:hypothetical protein